MKLFLMGLAGVLATCAPGAVDREDPGTAPASKRTAAECGDAPDQQSMNACFCERARSSQAVLDALLQELDGTLEPGPRDRMNSVQRTWTSYRDAQCAWQAAFFEGGTGQPAMRCGCLDTLTWSRIAELKIYLCEGFGMTGGCEASQRYEHRAGEPSR